MVSALLWLIKTRPPHAERKQCSADSLMVRVHVLGCSKICNVFLMMASTCGSTSKVLDVVASGAEALKLPLMRAACHCGLGQEVRGSEGRCIGL